MPIGLTFWEDYAAASAEALSLTLEPAWKAAVAANLETIFKMAASVDEFELPDDIEPAAIFEA
jgi:Protein of unknown function (DUF4089)